MTRNPSRPTPEPQQPKRPAHRPSTFTPELAATICERLGQGDLLIDICSEPDFPSLSTVHRWKEANEAFRESYARAREMQAHACAELAVRRGRAATAGDAAAVRVQFDADRWFAARLLPSSYGDRIATQPLDKDGKPTDPPVPAVAITITRDA